MNKWVSIIKNLRNEKDIIANKWNKLYSRQNQKEKSENEIALRNARLFKTVKGEDLKEGERLRDFSRLKGMEETC